MTGFEITGLEMTGLEITVGMSILENCAWH
jgi:hypothetical protein